MIHCPECNKELEEVVDTTYSNINSERAKIGQHTGDIYRCDDCEKRWLDNFLSGRVESDPT